MGRIGTWFAGILDFLVEKVYMLKVYGNTLMSPRVEAELRAYAALLTCIFGIELWAWGSTWELIFGRLCWQSVMLSLVFASITVLVDRAVIVSYTGPIRPDAGFRFKKTAFRINIGSWVFNYSLRVALLVLTAGINAVPVELRVFRPEIEQKIHERETASLDAIRSRARTLELSHVDDRGVTATMATQGDIATYIGERQTARELLMQSQETHRASLAAEVARRAQRASNEAAGLGSSGRVGASSAFGGERQMTADAQRALSDYNAQVATDLQNFDRATDTHVDAMRGQRIAAQASNESARQAMIDRISGMDGDELATQYGGTWREPRGFLSFLRTLLSMSAGDLQVQQIREACFLVMMVIGLMAIIIKITSSEEGGRYFYLPAQAAADNDKAKEALLKMGYVKHARLGYDQSVKDELYRYGDFCEAYTDAWRNLQAFITEQARALTPDEKYHYSFRVISKTITDRWMKTVAPTINGVANATRRLIQQGIEVPSWMTDENGPQPIGPAAIKFELTEALLTERGWKNPQPELDEIERRSARFIGLRQTLAQLIDDTDNRSHHLFVENPMNADRVVAQRSEIFWNEMVPLAREMNEIDDWMFRVTGERAKWPSYLVDPRQNLAYKFELTSQADLIRLGCRAFDRRPSVVSDPESQAALDELQRLGSGSALDGHSQSASGRPS